MRAITHCPVCQTQFFVSEQQLDQHHGQVRCGHCLHVFDAKAHSVAAGDAAVNDAAYVSASTDLATAAESDLIVASNQDSAITETEVSAHLAADTATADVLDIIVLAEVTDVGAATGVAEFTCSAETTTSTEQHSPAVIPSLAAIPAELSADPELPANAAVDIAATSTIEDNTAAVVAEVADDTAEYFDYLTVPPAATVSKKSRAWLSLVLLLVAIMQSLYFLRNPLAIYYPGLKPYLQQACHVLGCSIDLPKKIELIIIDDSDIQEDADHAGLIHFTSTLINQAGFHQAYPNVELTLTDLDDKPSLRRLFKPRDYLPAQTKIEAGIAPAEEVRVKLAISVAGMPVAGYRVFLTY